MMDMLRGFLFVVVFFCYFCLMAKEKTGLDLEPHFSVSTQVGITLFLDPLITLSA